MNIVRHWRGGMPIAPLTAEDSAIADKTVWRHAAAGKSYMAAGYHEAAIMRDGRDVVPESYRIA